jgi:hypothetical protein
MVLYVKDVPLMKNKDLLGVGMVYKNRGKYVLIGGGMWILKDLHEVRRYAKDESHRLKKKVYLKKVYHYFKDV